MMEEARRKAEEKVKNYLVQNDQYIQALKTQNAEVISNIRKASDTEIALVRHQTEAQKQSIINELSALFNEKREKEQILEQLKVEIESYEKAIVKTKIRILQKFKAERELELERLAADYDEKTAEVVSAIELIQSKLNEWSGLERAAFDERVGREEIESRNKLSLGSRTVDELRELYDACGRLRLSNPTPLYKAIYEIYLRGPVKELGVKLDASGKCGIYKITNVLSGKVYVGQSVDIAERWKQHIKRGCKCDVGTLSGAGLYDAMWEDGVWNFSFCILETCERSELNAHEKFWIEHFQSNEIGYNKKA